MDAQQQFEKNRAYGRQLTWYGAIFAVLAICGFIAALLVKHITNIWSAIAFTVIAGTLCLSFGWRLKHIAPKEHARSRPLQWIVQFGLFAIFLIGAIDEWNKPTTSFSKNLFAVWVVIVAFFVFFAWAKTKSLSKLMLMTSRDPDLQPKDEREQTILQQATERAFVTGVATLGIVSVVVIAAPSPSSYALWNLFVALTALFIGLRNFYAWLLGY